MALIQLQDIRKHYQMGDVIVRALDGVDLTIEKGEFVAITGASGSGKSTMMHLLGCLDRPDGGRYVLDGQDVSDLSDRELAEVRNRRIGFVFQTFNLINRTTAVDNVAVPLFYARKAKLRAPAQRALQRVGLDRRAFHRPNELSGGERQRVAIARAIVNDPLLLLADEPTGNLDSRTGAQIMDVFHDLNAQGVTVVLVTHELDVAVQARRIVHMRDGCILSDRLVDEGERQRVLQHFRAQTIADEDAGGQPRRAVPTSAGPPEAPRRASTLAANLGLLLAVLSVALLLTSPIVRASLRMQPPPTAAPSEPALQSLSRALRFVTLSALAPAIAGVMLGRRAWRSAQRCAAPRGRRRALVSVVVGASVAALVLVFGLVRVLSGKGF